MSGLAEKRVRDAWEESAGRALASGLSHYRKPVMCELQPVSWPPSPEAFIEIDTLDFVIERRPIYPERREAITVTCEGKFVARYSEPLRTRSR